MSASITWNEAGASLTAVWCSGAGNPPPQRVVIGDDALSTDTAFRLASEGTAILWRGDFQNARQLLTALARRIDRSLAKPRKSGRQFPLTPSEAFHRHRLAQSQRARTLGMLLLPFDADYGIPLRRAPDVRQACAEAYGENTSAFIASLRELLGLIGAHEWRKKGIPLAVLGGERVQPHYGVFSPVRSEYLELVAQAPLPSKALAFDIGTGTGVLAALLARRGMQKIVATDQDPRALVCAKENIERLGLAEHITVEQQNLFPPGRAPLVVCNPPWVPARPSSPLEQAIFDPDSRMLRGFLDGLAAHLESAGEGWLILSDLAEHFGLRTRQELLGLIDAAGLRVVGRLDIRPRHPKATDAGDPLHVARAAEVTSLWRLAHKHV